MSRQFLVLAWGGAGLLMVTATAWAIGYTREPVQQPVQQQTNLKPTVWAERDRVEVSRAQVAHAIATRAIDREVKSLLAVSKPMRHGDFKWNDRHIPQGKVWVRVDLDTQLVSVFRAGHEIGTAVILFGAEDKETPSGLFPVLSKIKDHHSATYDAPMPYTLRLTDDGIAVHGSEVRWGRATRGCIGVPREFARRLFDEVRTGDEVLIVGRG